MRFTEYFDDLCDLREVDWGLVNATYWADTDDDGDRKRRKQAEFLVHEQFAWEHVRGIVVRSDARRQQVEHLLSAAVHRPEVLVRPSWYY
jgi:hypothetical protein